MSSSHLVAVFFIVIVLTKVISLPGRRAMKFYMSLFLSMNEKGVTLLNSDKITQLLHTSKLGESVGRSLKLGEVMRWTPAVVSR